MCLVCGLPVRRRGPGLSSFLYLASTSCPVLLHYSNMCCTMTDGGGRQLKTTPTIRGTCLIVASYRLFVQVLSCLVLSLLSSLFKPQPTELVGRLRINKSVASFQEFARDAATQLNSMLLVSSLMMSLCMMSL